MSDVRSANGSSKTGPSVGLPVRPASRFCVRCSKDVHALGGRFMAPGMFLCALHAKPITTRTQ